MNTVSEVKAKLQNDEMGDAFNENALIRPVTKKGTNVSQVRHSNDHAHTRTTDSITNIPIILKRLSEQFRLTTRQNWAGCEEGSSKLENTLRRINASKRGPEQPTWTETNM